MKKIAAILALFVLILLGCCDNDSDSSAFLDPYSPGFDHKTEFMLFEDLQVDSYADNSSNIGSEETVNSKISELITDNFHGYLDERDITYVLSDDNYYSKSRIDHDVCLRFTCDTEFFSLYLIWDKIPGVYELHWDSGHVSCGQHGFLHEYIEFPRGVTNVWFVFESDKPVILCDAFAFTEGTPLDFVQVWNPPCEQADILVFPTHSDDDTLFFGPLISYYAIERELCVQTAFMVDHRYYPERGHERLNGLWEMGVRNYPILGHMGDTDLSRLTDSLYFYSSYDILGWQVEQIRRFQPLVVVGHDLQGEYGNGGHKVNAYFLVQAVELAADPSFYPELLNQYDIWNTPKLYLHLYPHNEIILDVNSPLVNDPDQRSSFQIAVDAYSWHKSQHHLSFRVCQDEAPRYDSRRFGLYYSNVGADTINDIMDNTQNIRSNPGNS